MFGVNIKMVVSKWDNYFMSIAELTAGLSHATILKVGAVAVRDKRVICTGFNGTPPGADNTCEHIVNGVLKTKRDVEHAERNLVFYAARYGIKLDGADLYVTHMPCEECARSLLLAGFSRVIYKNYWKTDAGILLLVRNNVTVYTVK